MTIRKKNIGAYHDQIIPAKFWAKVKVGKPDECWEWQRAKNTTGYGLHALRSPEWLWERTGRSQTQLLAHRVAYYLSKGDPGIDDESNYICHHCDNRLCCNPDHMFLGSMYDNVHDMIKKMRGFWQRAS